MRPRNGSGQDERIGLEKRRTKRRSRLYYDSLMRVMGEPDISTVMKWDHQVTWQHTVGNNAADYHISQQMFTMRRSYEARGEMSVAHSEGHMRRRKRNRLVEAGA